MAKVNEPQRFKLLAEALGESLITVSNLNPTERDLIMLACGITVDEPVLERVDVGEPVDDDSSVEIQQVTSDEGSASPSVNVQLSFRKRKRSHDHTTSEDDDQPLLAGEDVEIVHYVPDSPEDTAGPSTVAQPAQSVDESSPSLEQRCRGRTSRFFLSKKYRIPRIQPETPFPSLDSNFSKPGRTLGRALSAEYEREMRFVSTLTNVTEFEIEREPMMQKSGQLSTLDPNSRLSINESNASEVRRSKSSYGGARKCLGTRSGPAGGFKPPVKQVDEPMPAALGGKLPQKQENPELGDERYKNIDPKMIELIINEIMDTGSPVHWDDIAGLEFQKKTVKEIVVLPMLRPDIFTGLRSPPKGLLLFGPPGTGKTLIGKCIASQSRSTFFSISASSLTSKWVGEGEKMVRTLFAVARVHAPSVIFIDEIDSLLSARSESEHESSRRMKTEFLVQLDGAGTLGEEKILIVGATNRPQELDEAARRRLVKRLLIPLPEAEARRQIIVRLLGKERNELSDVDINEITLSTAGYSGADMANVCREAAMGPIRSIDISLIETLEADQVRAISKCDLVDALRQVKASVSDQNLQLYQDWNEKYGAGK